MAARYVQARLDVAETGELSLALHRIGRSFRQTMALEARLERDRQRRGREARDEARQDGERRASRRRAQVHVVVERLIWTETDGDEAERLLGELDERLDEYALHDTFAHEAVEAHLASIRADLGLAIPESEPSAALGSGGGWPPFATAPPDST